jgi:hypothetical protein
MQVVVVGLLLGSVFFGLKPTREDAGSFFGMAFQQVGGSLWLFLATCRRSICQADTAFPHTCAGGFRGAWRSTPAGPDS